MPRVVHFEFPADDVERARKFYEDVFGWKFQKWEHEEYWLITTGDDSAPGINGGMMPRQMAEQAVVNTLDVADLDAAIAKVKEAGGNIVLDKMPVPTIGWLAYFADPEGNIFGMMQMDPNAG